MTLNLTSVINKISKICLTKEELQHFSGFKWSKTHLLLNAMRQIFAAYTGIEIISAAVENTGRTFETEKLIWLYTFEVLLMKLLQIKSTLMQKQFLTPSISFTLGKARQCSEYLLFLLKKIIGTLN